ncbi:MAG: GNAT family N-acetyltransferase [Nocardioides sp.]
MSEPPDELSVIERYYDTVPRVSATTEEVGPFTLFLATPDTSWQFYARPRLGLAVDITADDVRRVVARQDELGVPRAIEWVHETTPSLVDAVREALPEVGVEEVPLMVSRRDEPDPRVVPGRREVLEASSGDLAAAVGAIGAAFGGKDEFEPGTVGARPRLIDQGTLVMVAAYDGSGALVGGGSASPRGAVAELMGIAILPSARGQGQGTAITTALRSELRGRGVDLVFLTAASDDATSIYRAVGFERLATGCIVEPADD